MNKYLDELDDELGALEQGLKDAQTALDNAKEDFDHMEWQLDDIKNVLKSNQTAEEKIDEIESIIAR